MTGTAAPPRANTPRPAIQVSAPSAHSASPAQPPPAPEPAPTPPPPTNRRSSRSVPDYLSDKATEAFIRRTLCPQQPADKGRPIEELLPPLTSRNDVDLQLYAFLAVILKQYVQAWYSKITPDESFVAEIVQIVAHCTRALEQRLRKVDLESLLFDEIPDLLDRHIAGTGYPRVVLLSSSPCHWRHCVCCTNQPPSARRASRHAISRPPTEVDPREVYHSLCPFPYMSPVPKEDDPDTVAAQKENETAYRSLLVEGVLAILLPTEDLENPCLTTLVNQILAETIIGNIIANKASQPWLIYEGLSILARNAQRKKRQKGRSETAHRRSRSEPTVQPAALPPSNRIYGLLFSLLHWAFLAYAFIRLLVTTLASASSFPPRAPLPSDHLTSGDGPSDDAGPRDGSPVSPGAPAKAPVADFRIWACAASLIDLRARMPWLGGAISMMQLGLLEGPGRIAGLDGVVDR